MCCTYHPRIRVLRSQHSPKSWSPDRQPIVLPTSLRLFSLSSPWTCSTPPPPTYARVRPCTLCLRCGAWAFLSLFRRALRPRALFRHVLRADSRNASRLRGCWPSFERGDDSFYIGPRLRPGNFPQLHFFFYPVLITPPAGLHRFAAALAGSGCPLTPIRQLHAPVKALGRVSGRLRVAGRLAHHPSSAGRLGRLSRRP